ncbi:MAG: TIGR02281 family clan AA aspartic protease [Niastella sp.]|jgi:predicted aspartyl protease|uniref:retropepsin-like aspartic protease family protein n=1 Tax=Niastella sp. TaxID=1869183 RepID=UPI00389B09C3
MRILLFFICFFTGFVLQAADRNPLDSLLVHRHFFELQRQLQSDAYRDLPAYKRLYYQAFLHNFFHDLTTSNNEIAQLLAVHKDQLTSIQIGYLLMKKIDNHVKLFQYRDAHLATQLLLHKYRSALSPEEREDVRNSDLIWKGLQDVPAQITVISSDNQIGYRRDLAGLITVPVSFVDSSYYFVFDTGANISVITESYARKANLRKLNVRFKVRAITGLQVNASLGIADELRLGNIVVQHAVFMIFPDSSLSFARGQYKIKGILGFPIIEQLQEIHIDKNNLTVPQVAVDRNIRNFGVDELLPVISVGYNTDTLAFTFDTGAQFTFLNEPFYHDYKTLVDTAGYSFEMQIGGAGGIAKSKAYRLSQIPITVAGQTALLKDVAVKTSSPSPKDKLYYGNFGQDIMNQFKEMVINFRYMYVDFVK